MELGRRISTAAESGMRFRPKSTAPIHGPSPRSKHGPRAAPKVPSRIWIKGSVGSEKAEKSTRRERQQHAQRTVVHRPSSSQRCGAPRPVRSGNGQQVEQSGKLPMLHRRNPHNGPPRIRKPGAGANPPETSKKSRCKNSPRFQNNWIENTVDTLKSGLREPLFRGCLAARV